MTQRCPVYAEADITVVSDDGPPDATVERVYQGIESYLAERAAPGTAAPHAGEAAPP